MKTKQLIAAILALCCLLALFAGCSGKTAPHRKEVLELPKAEPPVAASDYAQIRTHLVKAEAGVYSWNNFVYEDAAEVETAAPADGAPMMEAGVKSANGADDFSGTNVQVAGIDEADIVKTDGKSIFALCGNEIRIYNAAGADTQFLTSIGMPQKDDEDYYPREMFLDGGKLFLLCTCDRWATGDDSWDYGTSTQILSYDVSDPAKPALIGSCGQDGYFETARLNDGKIYLISNEYSYTVFDDVEDEEWVPCTYCNSKGSLIPPEKFLLCPTEGFASFTIIGTYSCESCSLLDVLTLTGSTGTVYMSENAVYLTQSSSTELASEPYTEKQYKVTDYKYVQTTDIYRIREADGKLSLDGSTQLTGSLLNQFALDEYNGMLRVAVSEYSNEYSVYRDEEYEFENYVYGESVQNTALYVLDENLEAIGSVPTLAADEQIYSVRYLGDMAYVVTYESIDPVFAIDLSDPKNPVIESSSELPGVSDYLHSYGEGLLFGFGRSITEDVSDGLQLNMFDVSDTKNITLITSTVIENEWSDALYNHKALLISPEKNLIAFPVYGEKYFVYGYENGSFVKRTEFTLGESDTPYYWNYDEIRGLFIGEYLYFVSGVEVCVVDLNSFETVAMISSAEG